MGWPMALSLRAYSALASSEHDAGAFGMKIKYQTCEVFSISLYMKITFPFP